MSDRPPITTGTQVPEQHSATKRVTSHDGEAPGALRVIRRAAPVALLVAVAVHGTLSGLDAMPEPPEAVVSAVSAAQAVAVAFKASGASHTEMSGLTLASDLALALAAGKGFAPDAVTLDPWLPGRVESDDVQRKTPRQLEREQANITRFIASRYRVTLDATSEFVHHAYQAARDARIDPMLVLAVMSVESSFDPRAQSSAGAQGLMQVLTRVHVEKFLPFGGIRAAFDPVANIRVGSAILREYIQRDGSVEAALKSYVGAALMEHDSGYGAKVLNARDRIAAAAAGKPIPAELIATAPRLDRPLMVRTAALETSTPDVASDTRAMPVPTVDAGRLPSVSVPATGTIQIEAPSTPAPLTAPPASGNGDI